MAIAIRPKKLSYLILSILGAVSHNIGQIVAASLLFKSATVFYYLPVLIVSGVLMGTLTAVLMKALLPALKRISGKRE